MPPFVKKSEIVKYNRWTFLKQGSKPILWVCKCDCGTVKEVNKKNVKAGLSRSCGCLSVEAGKAKRIHPDLPEFKNWQAMVSRCVNEKNPRYEDYGGRGIAVCDRWLKSFDAFYEDMGPKPTPDHTIDRKDNDAGYDPENCRWATRSEQQRNKRTTKLYEHDGRLQCATAWAEEFGKTVKWMRSCLARGMTVAEALVTPKKLPRGPQAGKPAERIIEWNGESKTMAEWAEEFGIPIKIFNDRLRSGFSMEKIRDKPLRADAKRSD